MSRETLIDLLYLFSATTFVLALKGLGSPKRARYGNMVAAFGMLVAIVATFFKYVDGHALYHVPLMLLAMFIGLIVAVPVARFVKMTAMPQLVAIFNGVGGGAASLVSITEFVHIKSTHPATYVILEVLLGVLIGTVSFAGSAIAFAKLQELMTGRPVTYPGQQVINGVVGLASLALIVTILVTSSEPLLWVLLGLAFVLGVIFVLPIGGADVPVLISLLNAFTGLAVAASGFTLGSNLLIVAGTLVGASGILLTRLMSKAMGRSLPNILFSAFGATVTASGDTQRADGRSVRSGTPEDIAILLGFASRVVFVPGYGLAVSQGQHVLRELAEVLDFALVPNFRRVGPRLGEAVKELRGALAALDPVAAAEALESGRPVTVTLEGEPVELTSEDVELRVSGHGGFAVSRDRGEVVALDLALDEGLVRRGLARDVVRQVQDLRKVSGLEVADRIVLRVTGLDDLGEEFASIAREVLAVEVLALAGEGEGSRLDLDDGRDARAWIVRV